MRNFGEIGSLLEEEFKELPSIRDQQRKLGFEASKEPWRSDFKFKPQTTYATMLFWTVLASDRSLLRF